MGMICDKVRRAVALTALLLLAGWGGQVQAAGAPAKQGEAALRKKALELNELTGNGPMLGKLQEMVDDAEGTKKLLAVAVKMAKEKPQPFNRNAVYLLALAADHFKEVDTCAAFYRLYAKQSRKLYSERGMAQAYLGLIQMYQDNKRFAESEKVCREFLAQEGEKDDVLDQLKPLVLRRMVLAIARQGSIDKALDLAKRMVKEDPSDWRNRVLEAQVLRYGERLEEAAKAYLGVIERIKKDDLSKNEQELLIDEYRYTLSGIYSDLDQVDKAAEQLKLLLARDPSHPTYNNDLGFIWADRGLNLAEAEKLIRKAIEEDRKQRRKAKLKGEDDRDSSAYLDSLGWVLFKQGKAKEAKPYLLEAVKDKEGQHIEIYDHLGDIHQALGETAEAVAAWKKALTASAPRKRDQKRKVEVEKKIKSQLEKKDQPEPKKEQPEKKEIEKEDE
jgi:tetratricopeptide (TPR) repeat protein